jgi:hypothetical protein
MRPPPSSSDSADAPASEGYLVRVAFADRGATCQGCGKDDGFSEEGRNMTVMVGSATACMCLACITKLEAYTNALRTAAATMAEDGLTADDLVVGHSCDRKPL